MDVMVVLGSKSDSGVAEKIADMLKYFGITYEVRIASAHRTPAIVESLAKEDVKIFIAVAGLSAALPGVIAAHTTRPVIGVPVAGQVPYDSLLSMAQMPPGVPVATVGVNNGKNAALLAIEILALENDELGKKLTEYRKNMREKVINDDSELRRSL